MTWRSRVLAPEKGAPSPSGPGENRGGKKREIIDSLHQSGLRESSRRNDNARDAIVASGSRQRRSKDRKGEAQSAPNNREKGQ